MSAQQSLRELFREKKQESEDPRRAAERKARREERIRAITALFDEIEAWLKPSRDEGSIKLEREPCELHDDVMGSYQSERLRLEVGTWKIDFTPVGQDVAGASARWRWSLVPRR
ncbi:hypothetical protein [Chondromyces apiculatus]|uniref:hypothetical protein n=1 Tax=Chondromyces apiculatus TaxID=51 RepID=UPI0012DFBFF8|nr:hypothetical protein [Chondromyces apiculatus]